MPSHEHFMGFTSISLLVLGAAVWRLRGLAITDLELNALIILALCFGLMFLQLLPLPQSMWAVMGGRSFVVEGLAAAQISDSWHGLSLSPEATRQDILALLPGAATFIAMLTVPREATMPIVLCIVGLAIVGLLLSAGHIGAPTATGVFINPNFFAAQLYMAIPFAIYLAGHSPHKAITLFTCAFGLVCVAGIGQSGSRFGLLIAVAVTIASIFNSSRISRSLAAYGLIAITSLTVVILLFGGAGLERFIGFQTALSLRAQMFNTSLEAMFSFLPAGSGFGSFVPVYQLFEAPAAVTPHFVNHAHNDWLELLIEGGVLAAVLMLAFLRWFGQMLNANWHSNSELGKTATISALAVLLHSLADYPMRTPALLVLFACCCGMMARANVLRTYDVKAKPQWNLEPKISHARAML